MNLQEESAIRAIEKVSRDSAISAARFPTPLNFRLYREMLKIPKPLEKRMALNWFFDFAHNSK